jgi:geranylgeranyl pyrophosphate synthase
LAGRPTVMLALAFQAADDAQREQLRNAMADEDLDDGARQTRLKQLMTDCGVFEQAEALVDKARVRAESLADEIDVEPLRRLLYFLVDTVLTPEDESAAPVPTPEDVLLSLPVAQ